LDFGFSIAGDEGGILAPAVCFLVANDIFHASSVERGVGQWRSNRTSTESLTYRIKSAC
jgi:hypothetical protein